MLSTRSTHGSQSCLQGQLTLARGSAHRSLDVVVQYTASAGGAAAEERIVVHASLQ